MTMVLVWGGANTQNEPKLNQLTLKWWLEGCIKKLKKEKNRGFDHN